MDERCRANKQQKKRLLQIHVIVPVEDELRMKYLHQNKEASKEQQSGPLHAVQDHLKVLDVSQDQKPQ